MVLLVHITQVLKINSSSSQIISKVLQLPFHQNCMVMIPWIPCQYDVVKISVMTIDNLSFSDTTWRAGPKRSFRFLHRPIRRQSTQKWKKCSLVDTDLYCGERKSSQNRPSRLQIRWVQRLQTRKCKQHSGNVTRPLYNIVKERIKSFRFSSTSKQWLLIWEKKTAT